MILNSRILAADLTVDCSENLCTKTGTDPLFNKNLDGYWFPGRTLTKTVLFKNSSKEMKLIAIKASRTSPPGALERVTQLKISGREGLIWVGTLNDFYQREKIEIRIFSPRENRVYDFILSLKPDLGDEYANLQTVFDLEMGFWNESLDNFSSEVLGEKTQEEPVLPFLKWWLLVPIFLLILIFLYLNRHRVL